MKIYIAAKFQEKERVRKLFKLVKDKGHKITADWTLHKSISPYIENQELSKDYAIEDINGVKDCDIFIQLSHPEGGIGVFIELGAAILSNIIYGKPKIFIIGDHNSRSMFYFHPSVKQRKNIEGVLKEIEKSSKTPNKEKRKE